MKKVPSYLFDYVKKKVDLSDFLETYIGCNLKWYETNVSAGTLCPIHRDSAPSFRLKLTDDNVWIFNCFGCGKSGTIIDFCMDYYGITRSDDAVLFICDKLGFEEDKDLVTSYIKDLKKTVDINKKMEYEHIITANQCRMLLSKDYDGHKRWIRDAYSRMNKALDEEDIGVIENVGAEASKRMSVKYVN